MGFLKRFFRNVFRESETTLSTSSFEHLSEEQLEAHLSVRRYGNFILTDAIRPSYDLEVIPSPGYRHDVYHDEESRTRVPVLMASASKESVFEVFIDLLDLLSPVVDVVIETSHTRQDRDHVDLYREHIDIPVLKSVLWNYEELLTNDGCTGIAVLDPRVPQEIQFDEHKLIIVYGDDLEQYEQVFREHHLPHQDDLKFITEAEHVHSTSDRFAQEFEEFKTQLGIDRFS